MKKDTDSQKFQTGNVLLISFSHLLHDTYSAFLSPLLPLLIKKLSLSYSLAGFLAVSQSFPSLLNPFVGVIADKVQMRYFIIIAPAITAITMSLLGIAPSYPVLVFLSLITGISTACYHVPSPVMMKRVAGNRVGKSMSFYMLGGEFARTLGPLVIVSAVSLWGLEGTYKLIPFGMLASFFLFVRLKDINIQQDFTLRTRPTGLKQTSKDLLPLFFSLAGLTFFTGAMKAALTSFLPTYLTTKGVSISVAGVSLSILQMGGVIGTFTSGSLSDRLGRKNVLLIIAVIAPLLTWLFLFAQGIWFFPILVFLGFFLFSMGPVILALVQDRNSEYPAYVNGVYMMINFVVQSVMIMIVGMISDRFGFENTYRFSALLSIGAIPCVLLLPGKVHVPEFITKRYFSRHKAGTLEQKIDTTEEEYSIKSKDL
jgi:FSR family fosmidomycin resistance protein-like MFS transporter